MIKSKGLYVSHLKRYREKIKKLDKSRTAWLILAVGLFINLIYLLCIYISDRGLIK